jgi:hypothetical protein
MIGQRGAVVLSSSANRVMRAHGASRSQQANQDGTHECEGAARENDVEAQCGCHIVVLLTRLAESPSTGNHGNDGSVLV